MEPPIPKHDEGMSVVAHLSGLAGNLFAGGGFVFPLLLMLTTDSPVVRAISKQALILNVAILVGNIVLGLLTITVVLMPITIPLLVVISIVGLVLPIIGAVKAASGVYYRYPVVGDYPVVTAADEDETDDAFLADEAVDYR